MRGAAFAKHGADRHAAASVRGAGGMGFGSSSRASEAAAAYEGHKRAAAYRPGGAGADAGASGPGGAAKETPGAGTKKGDKPVGFYSNLRRSLGTGLKSMVSSHTGRQQ